METRRPAPPDSLTADTFDQAVEALVFASDVPLRPEDVARVYDEVTGAETTVPDVDAAVERLNAAYRQGGRSVRLRRWGGGLRLATVETVAPFVRALFADREGRRLSRALLETLSVIAYKQPVTKPEVDHVRGVSSDYALRQLLERGLVEIAGRSDSIGRPLLYATTDAFLDAFGLDALGALPSLREVGEILGDPAFNRERARLLSELAVPGGAARPAPGDGAPGDVGPPSSAAPPVGGPTAPPPDDE